MDKSFWSNLRDLFEDDFAIPENEKRPGTKKENAVSISGCESLTGTYPVLCAYSIFCRKIKFFAFLGDIFLIFGQ